MRAVIQLVTDGDRTACCHGRPLGTRAFCPLRPRFGGRDPQRLVASSHTLAYTAASDLSSARSCRPSSGVIRLMSIAASRASTEDAALEDDEAAPDEAAPDEAADDVAAPDEAAATGASASAENREVCGELPSCAPPSSWPMIWRARAI